MPSTLPQAIRDRVIALRDAGHKTREVSRWIGVSESWIRRVMQVRRERGQVRPRPRGGAWNQKVDQDRLWMLIQEQPDATIAELHARLIADGSCSCSVSAVDAAARRMNLTFKKKRSSPKSKTAPTSPTGEPDGGVNSPGSTPGS